MPYADSFTTTDGKKVYPATKVWKKPDQLERLMSKIYLVRVRVDVLKAPDGLRYSYRYYGGGGLWSQAFGSLLEANSMVRTNFNSIKLTAIPKLEVGISKPHR